jgi:LmbE family N-acetylglucosaminyl deacetylase
MNEVTKKLEKQVSTLLKNSNEMVLDPKNVDMLMPHPDYPHCDTYVVELVDSIKDSFKKSNLNISKSDVLSIFYKYNGIINADKYRLQDIMKYA